MSAEGGNETAPVDDRTPILRGDRFYCPLCSTYAHQLWSSTWVRVRGSAFSQIDFSVSVCEACNEPAVWKDGDGSLLYPRNRLGPEPHPDMPTGVLDLIQEAREVSSASRKSAAALLRLALQVLVDQLEPGKASINDKIGALVRRGLDPQVQKAMDVLRVVGNNAVHPGVIDLEQDDELLPALFGLLNLVVEQVIARPKHIASLYGALPATAQSAIARRDAPAKP